jgi:ribosomal protein S18 acetylase RimI-like enzyme
MAWEISSSPSELDESVFNNVVFDHGRRLAADGNAQALACFLRKDGKVITGGLGRTEYRRLFITSVWVTESLRGQGIGSEIITRIEQGAFARECQDALLETLREPDVGLYERLGYHILARIPNYVGDFARHIMLKSLTRLGTEQSIRADR